ncbi:MAG: BREX-1 system adenine-specific DNA-methyltransferase PglX [Parabacteroides sp.]|nr:BREX-1 system adenine-specific DNA-methyltransferase PglX [Parabacteroides sp.]
MNDMNKTKIRNFAVWARQKLISDITYKAGMLGITDSGIADKLPQSTADLHFYDIGTKNYAEISGKEISQRSALASAIRNKERDLHNYKEAFQFVVEEVAYTWFNRLIAIRFMEVNDYLPSGIRVLSSENKAKNEPDFVTTPFDTDLEFTPYEQDRIIQLKDENKLDELFRMLFIKQCNKLHDILPELFERTDDYSELLLTISFTDKDGVIYHLTHDIPESNFNIEQEGQVEIIGWLYQYYNSEWLEVINEKTAISKYELPAKTQFFTTDWIVRYMVENSLGRLWVEGHPTTNLKSEWEYYSEEASQTEKVVNALSELRKQYSDVTPEEIKVIDPCMGSGHILVYAFDVLMQIYESYGYTQRDAARSILVNNIYGLDIDERAYQLAYFAIMMKARQYNRRILNEGISPNLYAIQESNEISNELIRFIANGDNKIKSDLNTILNELTDAKEYGSIIDVTIVDYNRLYARIDEILTTFFDDLFGQGYQNQVEQLVLPLIKQAEIMSQKYDVVFTNPPYLGVKKYNKKLSDYISNYYKAYKYDLFSCFIVKIRNMIKNSGIAAMLTQQTWLNVDSFENLRKHIIENDTLISLAHLGNNALEGGLGTVAFVFTPKVCEDYVTKFIDLTEYDYFEKKNNLHNKSLVSEKNTNIFTLLPKTVFVYNVGTKIIEFFGKEKLIKEHSLPRSGLVTRNNNLFLKLWYEVEHTNIDFDCDLVNYSLKWYPHTKGGGYRKWYGNFEYVVNWQNNGSDIREFTKDANGGSVVSQECYFHEGLSWSLSTFSAKFSMRYQPKGFIFNVESPAIFDVPKYEYLLGFLNSCVAEVFLDLLSDNLHYKTNDIGNTPIIFGEKQEEVKRIVLDNIRLSKQDWDSFENSWDFQKHPLVPSECEWKEQRNSQFATTRIEGFSRLSWHFNKWEQECSHRFKQLKANEEELNRIFIDIYGLQEELSPEVADKDVTVRKADLSRDIRSLISYAVGCMFGRYSLDIEGVAYAGGTWDSGKYSTFIPDADNCLPITDEEYFRDDIVGRFVEFIKVVYGEHTLEDNLSFIANALGNKGATSRDIIRNYFLNDFIKDHIKTYQKRPIYWMFDSGKQNGFKALCYMHRWNADTTGNMRVEYLHRMQRVYDKEIERMQEVIDNSRDNKEISAASKRKEKLQKQIKETKDYDAKVAHLALSRINIDLDDGVKVNYEKVQTVPDGKKMQILAKI